MTILKFAIFFFLFWLNFCIIFINSLFLELVMNLWTLYLRFFIEFIILINYIFILILHHLLLTESLKLIFWITFFLGLLNKKIFLGLLLNKIFLANLILRILVLKIINDVYLAPQISCLQLIFFIIFLLDLKDVIFSLIDWKAKRLSWFIYRLI